MDVFSKEKRSRVMSRISGKDTKPELQVRSLLHGMGYRFRLWRKDLPGNPDIILPRHKKLIFVHGCFWHGHEGCPRSKRPNTNVEFWNKKIDGNMKRDKHNIRKLEDSGWMTLTLWTCEIKNQQVLENRLTAFLGTDQHKQEDPNP